MAGGLRLRTALDKTFRPTQGEFLTTVLVEVAPPRRLDRLPLNLSILIDCSESMGGEKLQRAQEACLALLDQLDPQDTVSVVSFASHARVLVPSQTTGPETREATTRGLSTLRAEGVTSLLRGLDESYRETRRRAGADRSSFVMLLSDGYPTTPQGYVDENTSPYVRRVDREMREQGVSLTTIGLGDAANYDQAFLRRLADAGNGQAYYCSSPTQLAQQFETEFRRIQRTVLSQVELALKNLDGTVRRLWRVYPDKKLFEAPAVEAGRMVVPVGTFQEGQPQAFLLDVVTNPEPGAPTGRRRLLEVEASWVGDGAQRSTSTNVVVELSDDERALAQRNPEVVRLATECLDALLEEELEQAVATGDVARQTSMLARKKQLTMRLEKPEATRILEEMEDSLARGEEITQDALARSSQATRPTRRLG